MKRVRLPKKVREALKAWRRLLKDDDVVRAHHELAIRKIR